MHLQLQVLNPPLPLIDSNPSELLVQVCLGVLEMVEAALELGDALICSHASTLGIEDDTTTEDKVPARAAAT
jgi:hypothetical protein